MGNFPGEVSHVKPLNENIVGSLLHRQEPVVLKGSSFNVLKCVFYPQLELIKIPFSCSFDFKNSSAL